MALLAFLKRFPEDASCWAHLEASRLAGGLRAKYSAAHVTPFEGTHLPLRVWFTAIYLVTAASKGVSPVKLGEQLYVTQKTAWLLCHCRRNSSRVDALHVRQHQRAARGPKTSSLTALATVGDRWLARWVVWAVSAMLYGRAREAKVPAAYDAGYAGAAENRSSRRPRGRTIP